MAVDDLPQVTGVVHRRVYATDGQGGKPFTAPSIGVISCQVQVASAKDMQIAGQWQAVVSHAVYLMPETEIIPVIGDYLVVEGRTFYVRVNNRAGAGYPYRKILVEEYQFG
jgi:hypothetical protein